MFDRLCVFIIVCSYCLWSFTHADYFPYGLALVAAAPPQAPGEVVARPQGDDNYTRSLDKQRLI